MVYKAIQVPLHDAIVPLFTIVLRASTELINRQVRYLDSDPLFPSSQAQTTAILFAAGRVLAGVHSPLLGPTGLLTFLRRMNTKKATGGYRP